MDRSVSLRLPPSRADGYANAEKRGGNLGLFCGRNIMGKLVYGFGVNDAIYSVHSTLNKYHQKCPYYKKWESMLYRCYSKAYQKTRPTYAGCTVCKEWSSFTKFKEWMKNQNWEGNDLDKDLMVSGNKIYSPDTCIFVSPKLNLLMLASGAARGNLPIGVNFNKKTGRIQSRIKKDGKEKWLGVFSTAMDAHKAWQKEKILIITEAAKKETDVRLIFALTRIANKIKDDLNMGIETKSF